jgi:hypothetical protein
MFALLSFDDGVWFDFRGLPLATIQVISVSIPLHIELLKAINVAAHFGNTAEIPDLPCWRGDP